MLITQFLCIHLKIIVTERHKKGINENLGQSISTTSLAIKIGWSLYQNLEHKHSATPQCLYLMHHLSNIMPY